MKIKVTQVLLELEGCEMATGGNLCPQCGQPLGERKPFTLRLACTRALSAVYRDEQNVSGDEKFERGVLAMKIYNEDTVELKAEEIAMVKKLVAKMYGPIVILQVHNLLEGKPAFGEKK